MSEDENAGTSLILLLRLSCASWTVIYLPLCRLSKGLMLVVWTTLWPSPGLARLVEWYASRQSDGNCGLLGTSGEGAVAMKNPGAKQADDHQLWLSRTNGVVVCHSPLTSVLSARATARHGPLSPRARGTAQERAGDLGSHH